MKQKLLLALLLSLSAVVSSAQVIFDPATYPQDSLPAGMTLDTIEGRVYVQIILNGWNSFIKIDPPVAISENATHFRTVAKLGAGVSGFELSKIKTFLKLVNPDFTELAASANASSTSLAKYQVKLSKIDQVGYIQVAGQEIVNLTAVTGDTLWLGKIIAVEVDPQAIFDPNIYDPDLLPKNMSIVELDGVKYCQIILEEGSSYLETFPFTPVTGTYLRTKAKYGGGVSGTEMSDITLWIWISNFGGEYLTQKNTGIPASPEWTIYKTEIWKGFNGVVETLCFEGLNSDNTPVFGDTVWIGKVRAITVKPGVVFDPAQYDPSELPAGTEIVSLGGTKYLQAVLNGWSSFIPVDPVDATAAHTHFSTDAKYSVGSSGFELKKVNTFLKLATADWTEMGAAGTASSAEFRKYSVPLPTKGQAAVFQFAGQETTNWNAVTGDTLWIGKVFFEDKAAPTAPGNLKADTLGSTVTLTWDASTDNDKVSRYVILQGETALDTVTAKKFVVTDLANGTYTFSVVALDASGNNSEASSVDATVSLLSTVPVQRVEKIKIYPNPVTSTLWINRVQDILDINVINITGSIVRTVHNTNMVDVADLREGLYLIQVKTPSGIYSATFIKE